jgi:Divergent InlB B-repeat domain
VAAAALAGSAHAQAAIVWCGGSEETTANRVPDLEPSSPNQIHVVYATPADGPDNFAALASPIASDVAALDAWWQSQDATRTLRWDLYPFAGCTSRYGQLDLGFLRLPGGASFYAEDSGTRLDNDVAAALQQDETTKTLVYFDGHVSDNRVCGESRVVPQSGGQLGTAYVFLGSDCDLHVGDGASAALTAAHELVHDLGGMPDTGPPHPCPGDRGHPCDSTIDVLYPFLQEGASLGTTLLDVGHDDYYGHNGDWWDVQDSPWLIHLPQFPLHVAVEGSGKLTLSLDADCSAGCSLTLDNGLPVQLSAAAAGGWRLAGWTGDCSDDPCTLTMDGPKSVTAVFRRAPQLVRVTVTGKGRVTSSPAGISCPATCAHAFAAGTVVRLVARPARGHRLVAWGGACTGRGVCSVRADQVRAVRVRFR